MGAISSSYDRHKLQTCASEGGKQFPVKEIAIQGEKRSTGKYKGKVPSPVIIKIDK
mgnify:CR=1 FL=1